MAALRDEWQAGRAMRQREIAQRRANVQADLHHYQQVREQSTLELRQTLAEHHASVQDETSLYLSQIQQDRQIQARKTAAMLQKFDVDLQVTVARLRQDNQQQMDAIVKQVNALRETTQATLAQHTHNRGVMGEQQQKVLAEYVDHITATVSDYLGEIAENRQAMAMVEQAQRHRDREALSDDVQAMRDKFALHHQQMRIFCEDLRQSVWGAATPTAIATPTVTPRTQNATTPTKSASTHSTSPPKNRKANPAPSRSRAKAKSVTTSISQSASSKTEPPSQSEESTETAVFAYLQSREGARLTEIESTLGINRFQAVDALRSLIQKNWVVQKDRTYYTQEEVVL